MVDETPEARQDVRLRAVKVGFTLKYEGGSWYAWGYDPKTSSRGKWLDFAKTNEEAMAKLQEVCKCPQDAWVALPHNGGAVCSKCDSVVL